MEYNSDKPIQTGEEDLLGRVSFSKQLAKAIYEYKGEDGLVVGLFGKWGTGKTSVINMAINEIDKFADKEKDKPLLMKFSPWNYSDKDNLISLFFQSLKNKIDVPGNEDLKNKVGKALKDYSDAFDALALVPIVGSGLAAILKTFAKAEGMNLMQVDDLDKTRKILEEVLADANKKIIIIIDDIDRLTNSQIRDIFQLVKQVADFPNVIYLLAMDREVVRSALAEVHNIDGDEYLEKIIQVSFELPELRKSKLNNIFFAKLTQVISSLPHEVKWDTNYWNSIFRNCVEPYIHTLRDVNRVINTFQFRYGMLYQETNFEDMVGITTLEVLEPKLYKWICSNKDAVCESFMHGSLFEKNNKQDYRQLYYEGFKRMNIDPDLAIKSISTMFPIFGKEIDQYEYSYFQTTEIRRNMRIADGRRFELYFMMDLDDIKVSRSVINACIYQCDREKLIEIVVKINKDGNIVYFLEELRALIDEIPYDRLKLIVSVLFELQVYFIGENQNIVFGISACDTAEFLEEDILKKIKTEDERYEIIRSAVENINKDGLGLMAKAINRIELSYGRLAGESEDKNEQVITLVHLEELEKVYVKRIHDIEKDESILEIKEFIYVFYLWECLDRDGAEKYVYKLLKHKIDTLKFICALAGKWHGTNGSGWMFYPKYYSNYISQDTIFEMIQKFDKSKLNEFTEIEQIKLASFVINYNKDERHMVCEKDAQKLVDIWKCDKKWDNKTI